MGRFLIPVPVQYLQTAQLSNFIDGVSSVEITNFINYLEEFTFLRIGNNAESQTALPISYGNIKDNVICI
jgi:hypothetical protein